MQQSSVAHLDLKPDNIVVQQDPKSKEVNLAIIDFNIAVFADLELTISRSDSTPGWSAPEISAEKAYDPLLADRWSCGCVLSFFMERMKPSPLWKTMGLWSQQLMNPNPSLRPCIPDLCGLRPQEMRTKPLIQPTVFGPGGAPRPKPKNSRNAKGPRTKEPRMPAQSLRQLPDCRKKMNY